MRIFPDATTLISTSLFSLSFYALTFVLGIILVSFLAYKEAKRKGLRREFSVELIIINVIAGIIFARFFWVLLNLRNYLQYIPYIFAINDGGFSLIGGILGLFFMTGIYVKERHLSALQMLDFIAPLYIFCTVIIRLGRSFAETTVFLPIMLDIVGFILIWFYFRFYKPGFKRGQAAALSLSWLGLTGSMTIVFKWDGYLKGQFILVLLSELLGIFLLVFINKRKVPKPILLFDLDGTIMDSRRMVLYCYAYLFKKYSLLKNFTMDKQEAVFGASLKEQITKFFPHQDANVLVQEYRQYQRSFSWSKEVSLFPKTYETLEYLWSKGYTIGLVSSRLTESCESWLKQLQLIHCFSVIVGRDQVKHPKPSPTSIMFACQRVKASTSNCVYVGDNITDIQAARRAGVYAIAFNTEKKKLASLKKEKPNKIINCLDELKDILKEDHAWTYDKM